MALTPPPIVSAATPLPDELPVTKTRLRLLSINAAAAVAVVAREIPSATSAPRVSVVGGAVVSAPLPLTFEEVVPGAEYYVSFCVPATTYAPGERVRVQIYNGAPGTAAPLEFVRPVERYDVPLPTAPNEPAPAPFVYAHREQWWRAVVLLIAFVLGGICATAIIVRIVRARTTQISAETRGVTFS
jgi:hypothetical protein